MLEDKLELLFNLNNLRKNHILYVLRLVGPVWYQKALSIKRARHCFDHNYCLLFLLLGS